MTGSLHLARPRVGLLGNPSDLYRGRVLGFTFEDFAARARLVPGDLTELVGPGGHAVRVDSIDRLDPQALPGGVALVAAALRRLAAHDPKRVQPHERPFGLELSSNIPRQVGLSGSSALVVAALRAMAEHFELPLSNFDCSELALAAETVELRSVAGPQDRVLQSYGGLLYMDFSEPRRDDRYQVLDPGLLPPVLVAYDPAPGEASGSVHAEVRARWERGEPQVRRVVGRFSELAAQGLDDLRRGDHAAFADRMDANLAARSELWPVPAADLELARRARECGAAAKLCGSGGALICVPREGCSPEELRVQLESTGWRVLEPSLSR